MLSAFDYLKAKNEIEELGFILFGLYDTSQNILNFRQTNDNTSAEMINSVYRIDYVDTVYSPLVDNNGLVYYYDCEKLMVGIKDFAASDTVQSIFEQNNGTVTYYSAISNYYFLSFPRGQDIFATMQSLRDNGNVEYVQLYWVEYGGYLNSDCKYFDTINEGYDVFRLQMNNTDTLIIIDYFLPNSPCAKVGGKIIYSNDSIDYYGVYKAGDQTISCNSSDTVILSNFNPEKSVLTVHYCDQYNRCFINRQLYPEIKLNTDWINTAHENILCKYTGGVLYIDLNKSESKIQSIVLYNMQGKLLNILQLHDYQIQFSIYLEKYPKGLLMAELRFKDGTNRSFKVLNK